MELKHYHNPVTGESYTAGNRYVKRLPDGSIFNDIPTESQLDAWGFLACPAGFQYPEAVQARMIAIKAELQSMDYLTSKEIDGEDMSQYGDYKQRRRDLRAEYKYLEATYGPQADNNQN